MSALKLAICNEMFEGWKIEDVFEYASKIGYKAVEIAPFTLSESVNDIAQVRRLEIRKAAQKANIEIVGLHWLLVSPKGLYINHPDDKIRLATQDYLGQLIEFCGDIGGKTMIVGSPKQRDVLEGQSYKDAWQRTVDVFRTCLKIAEARGVTLCIEPLDPEQTNFINNIDEALKMVHEINHPNFQTMLDVRSASYGEKDPIPTVIHKAKNHLRHIHSNDANGKGPGFGNVDFTPIIKALKEIDYNGWISTEVFDFKPDPETIARSSFEYLSKINSEIP